MSSETTADRPVQLALLTGERSAPEPADEGGREGARTSDIFRAALEDRLRERLPLEGRAASGVYRIRRSRKFTLRGRAFVRVSASVPRVSPSDAPEPLHGWPTPTSSERSGQGERNKSLMQDARLAGWPTPVVGSPNSQRGRGRPPERRRTQGHSVGIQDAVLYLEHDRPVRVRADGTVLTGDEAGMEREGSLDPRHAAWLMGMPEAWG